jgi:hypothetical protein
MQQQTDGNKSEERFGFLRFALSGCIQRKNGLRSD